MHRLKTGKTLAAIYAHAGTHVECTHTDTHTHTHTITHTHTRHVVALLGRTHALLGFTGYSACHDEIRALADVPPALLAAYRVLHVDPYIQTNTNHIYINQ